jgi:broad specificity phosphatase PhoE
MLREREYGDWDGFSAEQITERDPERATKFARIADPYAKFYFRYPNGESHADVAQRAAAFIARLHHSRCRHHVLFVHGVVQRAIRMVWFDRTIEWMESQPTPANASVLAIRRSRDRKTWTEDYLGDVG